MNDAAYTMHVVEAKEELLGYNLDNRYWNASVIMFLDQ